MLKYEKETHVFLIQNWKEKVLAQQTWLKKNNLVHLLNRLTSLRHFFFFFFFLRHLYLRILTPSLSDCGIFRAQAEGTVLATVTKQRVGLRFVYIKILWEKKPEMNWGDNSSLIIIWSSVQFSRSVVSDSLSSVKQNWITRLVFVILGLSLQDFVRFPTLSAITWFLPTEHWSELQSKDADLNHGFPSHYSC